MEFRVLGPLEIRHNGRALPCKGAKQRLLLAALLLRANEVVSSDVLIDALWGENPPATATKALQMHVSQLRRLLDPDLLVTRPPGYELHVDAEQLDLARFQASVVAARAAAAEGQTHAAAELFAAALSLWRGPPLADLTFEEFLQPDITRLEELRLTALEDRVSADLTLGRHAGLVAELEALVASHPLRERFRGQLMLALYRSGRQADALEVYRDTRRLLVDELGLEPSRELKALEQRILEQDPDLDPREPERGPAPDTGGLIGRDGELAQLLSVVDSVIAGRGAIVLIGGEPGIGKSRLAEALARNADERGMQVVVGRCWEAGGAPPLWPWMQALRGIRGDVRDDLAALFEAPTASGEDDPGARFRMFASVAGLLGSAAAAAPVALFLDDIHAADPASLLLLRFLAAQLVDMPALVIACFRDSEAGGALAETLTELAREPVVERMSLGGLDAESTAALLAAAIGAEPSAGLVERVQSETHGNPLFAGEIGRLLGADGEPTAAERLPIPEGVRDTIRLRLQRQSEQCRDLLVRASVLGREFDLVTLAQISAMTEEEMLVALDEASAARLVGDVPRATERMRFSHIMVRDALYEDLPTPRRVRLHREAGEAIEHVHAGNLEPHLAELAYHFVAAGSAGRERASVYSERAGKAAAARYGYEEAARHYACALELLGQRGAADPDHECDLLLALGDVYSRAGNTAEAKSALRRAASIADEHGWHDRVVQAALAYGGRFAWARASTDPALEPLLERALEVADPDDARARAQLLARLAATSRDRPTRERRGELARAAVELGRRSGDPLALAYALEGLGVATEGLRPAEEDLPTADELIALGTRLGDLERVFTGRDFRLNALWKLGDRAGVDVEIEALAGVADELHQPGQQWSVAAERTIVALMEGRFTEAEELIAQTRATGERAERWNAHVSERLQLFVLRRAQGRLGELEETMRRSVHEYPTLIRFSCALAHLHCELGDHAAARSALDALSGHDVTQEYIDAEWLFTTSVLSDVYRALADDAGAGRLYDALVPYEHLYAQAPIEATFGSVARALGVLAATTGDFDAAERHFELAIGKERQMHAWPWLAHAQHDFAQMLATRGERGRAATLAGQALSAYRELGMESWAERAGQLV